MTATAAVLADQATTVQPLGDRILVKRVAEKEQTGAGLFIPDASKERPQEGDVVGVGEGRTLDNGTKITVGLRVGDRVLFAKYAGTDVTIDGEDFLILREDEALVVIRRPQTDQP